MIVVDTSAVIGALAGGSGAVALRDRVSGAGLHAPHVIDLEFLQTLRRLVAAGSLSYESAVLARHDFADLSLTRYAHFPLADRVWSLRSNMSAYDAAFVALAESLGAPLVTTDARLARAPGHGATIELFTS